MKNWVISKYFTYWSSYFRSSLMIYSLSMYMPLAVLRSSLISVFSWGILLRMRVRFTSSRATLSIYSTRTANSLDRVRSLLKTPPESMISTISVSACWNIIISFLSCFISRFRFILFLSKNAVKHSLNEDACIPLNPFKSDSKPSDRERISRTTSLFGWESSGSRIFPFNSFT